MEHANNTNKPIKKFYIGAISAAIWENETKDGKRYAVTVTRRYKVEDTWRDTHSLRHFDLLKAIQLQARAAEWIAYVMKFGTEPVNDNAGAGVEEA